MDSEEIEIEFEETTCELKDSPCELKESVENGLEKWRIGLVVLLTCLGAWSFLYFLPLEIYNLTESWRRYFERCCINSICKTSENCDFYFQNWIRMRDVSKESVLKSCCYWFSPYIGQVSPEVKLLCNSTCLFLF